MSASCACCTARNCLRGACETHRPSGRVVQSGASRASAHFAERHACAGAGRGVVAGVAGQSVEAAGWDGAPRRAARLGTQDRRACADPSQRDRGRAGHALHRRHARQIGAAIPAASLHLADGRGQSGAVPPLARVAAHRPDGSDCGCCASGLYCAGSRKSCDELAAARCAARRPGKELDVLEIAGPRVAALSPRSDFSDKPSGCRSRLAPALPGRQSRHHIDFARADTKRQHRRVGTLRSYLGNYPPCAGNRR